jgi:CDP-paratose 2-epimerase
MTYLITGGCGFVGANIARRLLEGGRKVAVFDNLGRHGAAENLEWLHDLGLQDFIHGDIRNPNDVERLFLAAKPAAVFHLAGQVAMTASMLNPRHDFETNVVGSINVLENARRHAPEAAIVYSSSNKVYGDLGGVRLAEGDKRYTAADFPEGIGESAPLDFHTPYGCSKGAADQYMLDYARNYGLNTVVFRHSTIYGGRQYATFDQGWVGWFCQQAYRQLNDPASEAFTVSGDGKQVRDLLYVDDAVDCYLAAAERIGGARGQAFNIGGGMPNSCSLLELFDELEAILPVKLRYRRIDWRQGDQKFFVADTAKAARLLNWHPRTAKRDGIKAICRWVESLKDEAKG